MIITKLSWLSEFYKTQEDCSVNMMENEDFEVTSSIDFAGGDLSVSYHLTGNNGKVQRLDLRVFRAGKVSELSLERTFKKWTLNGETIPDSDDCIDIDISLTPFTNTLPIRRLNMEIGEESTISVVYIDVEELIVSVKKQRYVRTAERIYHFETVPKNFEANIEVNADGFVSDYPGLFVLKGYSAKHEAFL